MPSSVIRRSLFGMVMLCATDFLPLWKKVSGVQILLAIRLLRRSTAMGPLNFNLSSFQLCLKNTSIVYSYKKQVRHRQKKKKNTSQQKVMLHHLVAVFFVLLPSAGLRKMLSNLTSFSPCCHVLTFLLSLFFFFLLHVTLTFLWLAYFPCW